MRLYLDEMHPEDGFVYKITFVYIFSQQIDQDTERQNFAVKSNLCCKTLKSQLTFSIRKMAFSKTQTGPTVCDCNICNNVGLIWICRTTSNLSQTMIGEISFPESDTIRIYPNKSQGHAKETTDGHLINFHTIQIYHSKSQGCTQEATNAPLYKMLT